MLKLTVVILGAGLICGVQTNAFAFGSRAPRDGSDQVENLGSKVINDSLVSNLQCSSLDKNKFLLSVAPDAYSIDRQDPIENWATGQGLAECWSLAHTQRLFYYMGRFGQQPTSSDLKIAEDTIRGVNDDSPKVFFLTSTSDMINSIPAFKDDIEHYQDWRFYQPGNVEMIAGNRERSQSSNIDTLVGIENDLAQGRMPIVIIRAAINVQHSVLIKRMVDAGIGEIHFVVYDSNSPGQENDFYYNPSTQQFYAPSVVGYMVEDSESPIGVFLVDDDDMDNIQDSLFSYYTQLCKQ